MRDGQVFRVIALILIFISIICLFTDHTVTNSMPPVILSYFKFISIASMSFLLTPLFCFWIADNCLIFSNPAVILRSGGRDRIVARYGECAAVGAVGYVFLLNLAAMPSVLIQNRNILPFMSYFAASMLLQLLFFSVCSFLFFLIYLLTGSGVYGFIAVVIYGVVDNIGMNSPFDNWVYVGTARADAGDYYSFLKNPAPVFANCGFFLSLLIFLAAACVFVCSKKDFIGKNEGKSDE